MLKGSSSRWEPLRGARILLTGGTGFVGRWLVAAFIEANRSHGLRACLSVLTRDPDAFRLACPELAGDDAIELLTGDVRSIHDFGIDFTHVIHAATPSDGRMNAERPEEMLEIIVSGTRGCLELARSRGAQRLLLVSSGAVYLPPAPAGGFTEDSPIGPSWPDESSAYHAGKRTAESLAIAASRSGLPVTIARPFAFVGPHLPLDRHFAIGNFVGDALNGGPVRVKGDGTPMRSYLYAADMAVWLWTMLLDRRAVGSTYNVGSEDAVSIADAARAVADAAGREVTLSVTRTPLAGLRDIYVPSTRRAREELGLVQTVGFAEGIRRTLAWYRNQECGTVAR